MIDEIQGTITLKLNPILLGVLKATPTRWHRETIAAAAASKTNEAGGGSISDWISILDGIEAALTGVLWPRAR